MSMHMVDLSNHQTPNLDLYPADCYMFKATEGNYFVDQNCDTFVQQAKAKGKPYGVYHFLDNRSDVISQADFFVDNCQGYVGEAILCLDYEMYGRVGTDKALQWLERVKERTRVKPLVYMSESVTHEEDWSAVVAADYGLWVAKYSDQAPSVAYWPFYAAWQYTSEPYDKSTFNGDEDTWRAYATSQPLESNDANTPESGTDVVEEARKCLGITMGSAGHYQIVDEYNSKPKPQGYTAKYTDDWCDIFVTVMGDRAGQSDAVLRECSVERHENLHRDNGTWIGRSKPQSGDLVFYDWQGADAGWSDHIGIVESFDGNNITTIEGNTGNPSAVRRVTHYWAANYIVGYARPNYTKTEEEQNKKSTKFNIGDLVMLRGPKATHWARYYDNLIKDGGKCMSGAVIDPALYGRAFRVEWLPDDGTVEVGLLDKDGQVGKSRYDAMEWDLVPYEVEDHVAERERKQNEFYLDGKLYQVNEA
ncbi:GH25 family lysozyme [Aerococcus mictus]|uniref:GH25 family lysozyme n=1 Tax=Aerococcus mictus TaxID=2976810 RepID=UPI0018A742F1|nr:GH25 family lysozyme [Aerococcus mictus]